MGGLPPREPHPREIAREDGSILDFDLSPDGSTIAYLEANYSIDSVHHLKRLDLSSGKRSVLRTLGTPPGSGAGSEDEVSVAWSPDGRGILVTDTHVADSNGARGIFLLDRAGRDIVPAWTGTHARWSPDGRTIYYRGYAGTNGVAWFALDTASMRKTELGIRPGTNNLMVAPDGNRVAYDTSYFGDTPLEAFRSDKAPIVYTYDLRTGRESVLRKGALSPLWISADEILVTDARRPRPGAAANSWEPLGTVTKLAVGGIQVTVAITSTVQAATLFDRP
ncbi:MAG: PD40 domain-containing protein [Acidobacteria bacterium]|nr:PD40 domain-containing protein [Acidobacteriota bacterium]